MGITVVCRETGAEHELSIIDAKSGCDWIADLLGNAGALTDGQFERELGADGDPTGRYVADRETIDWWQRYIEDHETAEEAIEDLREDLEAEGLDDREIQTYLDRVNRAMRGTDYEMHASAALHEIEAIREEREAEERRESIDSVVEAFLADARAQGLGDADYGEALDQLYGLEEEPDGVDRARRALDRLRRRLGLEAAC